MFKKILVANRGEIAVRIIRACRELSVSTVAVYSEADRLGLPVQLADQAVCIGPASPLESYLKIDTIINAALGCGADAIHPGYGFLAENHDFAREVAEAGLVFIGPSAEAIRLMGNKVASRELMLTSGVPVIPGASPPADDNAVFFGEARKLGFPVLVKAAAGGGGKGMRVAASEKELRMSLESARREAGSAFGDSTVFLEKYIEQPRHVEIQLLADHHGKTIHFGERECSIQRRHQKIVEESPSTALAPETREAMGLAAVQAAQAVGYTNAGTVEFLLDTNGSFYFLEMNTRIQVEHPITELVTGVDLVQWQIRIAAGEPLTIDQEHVAQKGHAIECRIYAEDPGNNFMPAPGKILYALEPTGPGIRNDSAIFSGIEVTMDYDPILSKLIVWGEDREQARRRMVRALRDMVLLGIETTCSYLADVIEHPAFARGETFTDFIPRNMSQWRATADNGTEIPVAVLAAAALEQINPASAAAGPGRGSGVPAATPWQRCGSWQIGDSIPLAETAAADGGRNGA
jgi:acetyl-CoA carboxylase biotin carboxylase subunit